MAGYCQTNSAGLAVVQIRKLSYAARRVGFQHSPGENLMTISFRLFGFAVCFSITKVITLPCERLSTW